MKCVASTGNDIEMTEASQDIDFSEKDLENFYEATLKPNGRMNLYYGQLISFIKDNRDSCGEINTKEILAEFECIEANVDIMIQMKKSNQQSIEELNTDIKKLDQVINEYQRNSKKCSKFLLSSYEWINNRIELINESVRRKLLKGIRSDLSIAKWHVNMNSNILVKNMNKIKDNVSDLNRIKEIINQIFKLIKQDHHENRINQALIKIQEIVLIEINKKPVYKNTPITKPIFKRKTPKLPPSSEKYKKSKEKTQINEEYQKMLVEMERFKISSFQEKNELTKAFYIFLQKTEKMMISLKQDIEDIVYKLSGNQEVMQDITSFTAKINDCVKRLEIAIKYISNVLPSVNKDIKETLLAVKFNLEQTKNDFEFSSIMEDINEAMDEVKSLDFSALKQKDTFAQLKVDVIKEILKDVKKSVENIKITDTDSLVKK